MSKDKLRIAQQFVEALPHCREVGMRVVAVEDGVVEMELPYDSRLIGDPARGVIAGGAVSVLLDTCSGTAVLIGTGTPTATLNLRIDYFRAATPGQAIRARARCSHITRNAVFVRTEALDEDRDRPVAVASGVFTVDSPKRARG